MPRYKFIPINSKDYGTFAWIAPKKLTIPVEGDDAYQRDGINSHVIKIATEWNPRLLGSLTVIRRGDLDGELQVADGGQRLRAALLRNEQTVGQPNMAIGKLPCMVIDLDNNIEAARTFANIDTFRRKITFSDLHKARIKEQHPDHVNAELFVEELKKHGITFLGVNYLTKTVAKLTTCEALNHLLPLLIDLGLAANGRRLSTTLVQGLVRLECDIVPDSLANKRWARKITNKGADALHDAFSTQPTDRRDALSFAKVLRKMINLKPNPYVVTPKEEEEPV